MYKSEQNVVNKNQEKQQTIETSSQVLHIMELSDTDFKITILNMVKKIKGKIDNSGKRLKTGQETS